MQLDLLPLALLAQFTNPNAWIPLVIPVVAIVVGGIIAVAGITMHRRGQRDLHETARVALEKGHPIPPEVLAALAGESPQHAAPRGAAQDVRGGLVLVAVGAGLWLMLGQFSERLRFIGAIPGFIGVALLIFAGVSVAMGRKEQPGQSPAARL